MAAFWFGTFAMLSRAIGSLVGHETLEDEQYVVIKAYKFTVFEIWRDLNVLSYIACPRYPYIRVYRLYDEYCSSHDRDLSFPFSKYNYSCSYSMYTVLPIPRYHKGLSSIVP